MTAIVAGAYAAYFTILSITSARFSDIELRWSAMLMVFSLSVFVMWEVGQIVLIGWFTLRGKLHTVDMPHSWQRVAWPAAITLSVIPAIAAAALAIIVYARGLSASPEASAPQSGRFQMLRGDQSTVFRLDSATGRIGTCSLTSVGGSCEPMSTPVVAPPPPRGFTIETPAIAPGSNKAKGP